MVWVADPDDVILAEVDPNLDFDNNDRLFGVIARRVMRAKRDIYRLASVKCAAALAKLHAGGSCHHKPVL